MLFRMEEITDIVEGENREVLGTIRLNGVTFPLYAEKPKEVDYYNLLDPEMMHYKLRNYDNC